MAKNTSLNIEGIEVKFMITLIIEQNCGSFAMCTHSLRRKSIRDWLEDKKSERQNGLPA